MYLEVILQRPCGRKELSGYRLLCHEVRKVKGETMKKRIVGFVMLVFLTGIVFPWMVVAQNPQPAASCTGDSWPDGSYYPKGKQYSKVYNGRTYNCVGSVLHKYVSGLLKEA